MPERDDPNHSIRARLARAFALLAPALLAACGGGGGPAPLATPPPGPTVTTPIALPRHSIDAGELAVIVAQGDALSEAIGQYYLARRGLPAANLVRVAVDTSSDTIAAADFALLKARVDALLPAKIQATLLTWTRPSRVAGSCAVSATNPSGTAGAMGITSAMAFGFDSAYCGGCADTRASRYYDTETGQPWTDLRLRPSMMLGASTLAAAQALIDRGVASDATQPDGEGWLLRTTDSDRSVRYPDFAALPSAWQQPPALSLHYVDNSAGSPSANAISGRTGVLFYFTGLSSVPALASNAFRPGAVGDHLTSWGGRFGDLGGQMPVTDWLAAGATASYGTVEEPCATVEKFPRASVLIDQYHRGATVIEAYWKSVAWPGQGLFVGEPLARPFADAPQSVLDGSEYAITTRTLRRGSRYAVEYRLSADSGWSTLAAFTTSQPHLQTLRAPQPPAAGAQVRLTGPCPTRTAQTCTLSTTP